MKTDHKRFLINGLFLCVCQRLPTAQPLNVTQSTVAAQCRMVRRPVSATADIFFKMTALPVLTLVGESDYFAHRFILKRHRVTLCVSTTRLKNQHQNCLYQNKIMSGLLLFASVSKDLIYVHMILRKSSYFLSFENHYFICYHLHRVVIFIS